MPGINLAGEVAFDVPFGPPRGTRVVCVNDHLGQRCDGGYAEFARPPTQWLTALPDSMDNHTAMAMGTAGFTAMQCVLHLERSGALDAPDATVLVTGAAGGVGSFAVQIAVDLGATVIGTASESNHEYLRSLGATPVTYGDGLVERVRAIAPDGITASVDYVGTSEAIEASAELIADRSRSTSNVDPTAITEAGGRYCFVRPQADDLAHLSMLVDKGVLAIEVQQTFPLADAVKALRTNMEGHVRGKLALTVD